MSSDIDMSVPAVKNKHATTPPVDRGSTARQKRRFIKLIAEMGAERGHAHGWKSEVARLLGISQSYMSRLSTQSRNSMGIDAIEAARRNLKLRHEYFDGAAEPRSYHDFIKTTGHPYMAWEDFVTSELGQTMTVPERETLSAVRLHGYEDDPPVGLYVAWLLALRGVFRGDPEGVDQTARNYEDRENEIAKRGLRKLRPHPGPRKPPETSK